jgi:translation elongation factor EF-Tu-like GTPase
MVTGASTADLALILVDARKGVIEQTRRHSALSALLGIQHLVVCINQMDLVDWSQGRFDEIVADFRARKIPFFDWPGNPDNVTGRPDGFRQIYVQDPDNYWIEINDHTRPVA